MDFFQFTLKTYLGIEKTCNKLFWLDFINLHSTNGMALLLSTLSNNSYMYDYVHYMGSFYLHCKKLRAVTHYFVPILCRWSSQILLDWVCCFLGRFFNEEALWPKHSCFNILGHYWIKIVFYKQISLACFSNLDHLIFYQRKSQPQSFELAGYNLICTFSPLSS